MRESEARCYKIVIPEIDYYRRIIKCTFGCPINTPAGKYVQAVGQGDFERGYNLARQTNPFVYVCARVCAHPCEDACRRGNLDRPVAINALKRVATDHHNYGLGHNPEQKSPDQKRKERVAVIGSGPAGFSCAHDLALFGYPVTIFESMPVAGGMLALGLPIYRLPRDIIKSEIEALLYLGIELKTNVTLGKDITLSDLKNKGYEAIFIATGAHKGRSFDIEGAELDGVLNGVEFLLNVNLGYKVDLGSKICVVGGGNVAIDVARSLTRKKEVPTMEDGSTTMDAARTALRLGAQEVHVISLESREELPASEYEVDEAEKEGIILHTSLGPRRIIGKDGRVTALETMKCTSVFDDQGRFNPTFEEGVASTIPADTIILAIGQESDFSFLQPEDGLETTPRGTLKISPETLATTSPGIFAGGDCAFGPRIIVDAIADGQKAAKSIHFFLSGGKIRVKKSAKMIPVDDHHMPAGYMSIPRQVMPTLPIKKRMGITEVQLGFSDEQSALEGKRCLKCNINTIFNAEACILCGGCVDICPEFCLKMVPFSEIEMDIHLQKLLEKKLETDWKAIEKMDETEKRHLATFMIKDEENCIRCGLCAKRCPTGAITMESFEYHEEYVEQR